MIERKNIDEYVKKELNGDVVELKRLGRGVHGEGFLLAVKNEKGISEYVIKDLIPHDLGHDYPSDRAQVFLLAYDTYNLLPRHVKAIDVIQLRGDGSLVSIKDGKEYFLLMEKAEGRNYFHDLEEMSRKDFLDDTQRSKIIEMVRYLADIHSVKHDSKSLYIRKLRDTIGHGECLMGVFDTYPDGTLSHEIMAEVEKLSIDWRYRLKNRYKRLSQIHGDFHPGNIWFGDEGFILLDRSRGPYGEPADDITALTINYIFYSIMHHGRMVRAYRDALVLFYNEYIKITGDREIKEVVQPFYAFRASVVGNPIFYPELSKEIREIIFRFMVNVLKREIFEPEDIESYL